MSTPPPASRPRPTAAFAAVAMQGSDKLRFLQFPEAVYREGAGAVIRASWPEGVQAETYHAGSGLYEYRLRGSPFGRKGDAGGVASRVLVRNLLAYLHSAGWVLDASLAQSRQLSSKDTLIFRKAVADGDRHLAGPQAPPPPVLEWLALGLTGSDRLRLVGGCGAGIGEGTLVHALEMELRRLGLYAAGQAKAEHGGEAGFEFTFKHSMWKTLRDEQFIQARILIVRLVEVLDTFGWRSYATIRQRTGNDSYAKADTWYFTKAQG